MNNVQYFPKFLLLIPLVLVVCARSSGQTAVPQPVVDTVKIPDYGQHISALQPKVPDGFKVVVQRPFVVIGDESADMVQRRAEKTVKWAVDMLKKDFFELDPKDIIDIWLFKDDSSFYKHSRSLFGTEPTTPYGFYLASEKALLMNIATGAGTLVHEIVHPFMKQNFPDCPSWFNEGLASLYEQCGEHDGHITGYTNWRLKGLQTAIRNGQIPSFETLTATGNDEFYTEDPGTNYSQARYLCYYLQEKGSLVTFYKEFFARRVDDPTGYETLKNVLGISDMDKFKKDWEKFVLELEFP